MRKFTIILLLVTLALAIPGSALAQTYYFSLDSLDADVYWNEDGTVDIGYLFTFTNSTSADPIEYIDVGYPNSSYSLSDVNATVNGKPITDIERSPFVDNGVALGLGANSIPPGQTGQVYVSVQGLDRVLFTDDQDPTYASAVFSTTYFDRDFVFGNTNTTVTFHLPPGVQPEEPRWHDSPSGFQNEPVTGFDESGRITYTWSNPGANGYSQYRFGASFPSSYVPAAAIFSPTVSDRLQIPTDELIGGFICFSFVIFFFAIIGIAIFSARNRQLKYLPPKVSIEGHGIKRGLTAIEAAILMEQPMDKILMMILFAAIKKNAAEVSTKEPLELKVVDPLPQDLRPYEADFLRAFTVKGTARRKALQDTMVELVKSVSGKMKGFSRKETITYYEDIMRKAWGQVQTAGTPDVMSQKFDENMEWTMLDRDYDGRTREVFRDRPIFVPTWWGRYDPTFRPSPSAPSGGSKSIPYPTGGGSSLPSLPGADFAAAMVTGVQNFSNNVIGNVTDFTGNVTNKTNPVPRTSSGSGGRSSGGGGCACACACAGCACACAGGGR